MRTGTPFSTHFATLVPRRDSQAYILLVLTMLVWGANAVAARLSVGEVSPMLVTFLRWAICCVALAVFARREIRTHWRTLVPHWRSIVLMGMLGFTGFNAMFYAAAHHTTAINIAIIQGGIPVLVLIGSYFFYATRISVLQILGVLVTLGGIVVVASRGHLALLAQLDFNVGDVWMMLACLLYAGYSLRLRQRPAVPAIVFFAAMALVACAASLPLVAAEAATGHFQAPTTAKGIALVLFIGLLPSFLTQIWFIRAVDLIGPARAGVFMNLVPIFGPLLAVLVLGEPVSLYHGVALAMVLGGIYIAERLGARGRRPDGAAPGAPP